MTTYTFTEARRQLARVLEKALQEGAVQIRRRDGTAFTIHPTPPPGSPLDVGRIATDVTTDEIVAVIREGRERDYAGG